MALTKDGVIKNNDTIKLTHTNIGEGVEVPVILTVFVTS